MPEREEGSGEGAGVVPVTVVGGYRAVPASLPAMTRRAKAATALRLRTCGRLYSADTIFEGLTQDLQDMAAEPRQLIQKEHTIMRQRHFAGPRHLAAADQADVRYGVVWCGARHGRVGTRAVRPLVRPVTRGMRVVSVAPR
jgi:hypothetical protein